MFLTAIARNYDQSFIGEKPFLWLFGSLLFSLVSGTWLYLVCYAVFARWRMKGNQADRPPFMSGWVCFMGLFWMTAPVAWLYAIPVERFCDPVTAAKANVLLLTAVSFWRVLLMTRVIQFLTQAPLFLALFWVLFAAAIEVLVVFFFGGAFAESIMRGMGGMRNSPAEEVLLRAMGTWFSMALITVPVAGLLSLIPPGRVLQPMPGTNASPMPWVSLTLATLFWVGISIVPQMQVYGNHTVEKLFAEGRVREALSYLSSQQPGNFAPARELPPKPFERTVFEQLPDCFGVVELVDAPWVREFLIARLDEMMVHYGPISRGSPRAETFEDRIQEIQVGLGWHGPESEGLLQLVNGLERIPEGQAWLATNALFLEAVLRVASEAGAQSGSNAKPESDQRADWLSLSNHVRVLLPERFRTTATNLIDAPVLLP